MNEIKRENDRQGKSDIVVGGWIEQLLPAFARPYAYLARLDRPIGVWLLLLPGLWGITLAGNGLNAQSYRLFVLFFVGAVVMRAAGCVINDMWDRKLDRKVERTRHRPLASGLLSLRQAFIFLIILLVVGLLILLQMNAFTILLGFAVMPLIILYPLMKRFTWWPQAFLGLTFNFSVLMGWSAVAEDISLPAFILYASAIFWTLGYDTIYAFQDIEDDILAGVKSTARRFGAHAKKWVSGFYALVTFGLFIAFNMYESSMFSYVLIFGVALHLMWQLRIWKMDSPQSALHVFKANQWTGILILGACLFA